jgi:hypothetical protein
MPFFRNFTYWIDKRNWKYYFLMVALGGLPGGGFRKK